MFCIDSSLGTENDILTSLSPELRKDTLKTIELVILATDLKRHINTVEFIEQVVGTGIDFGIQKHASELHLSPRERLEWGLN